MIYSYLKSHQKWHKVILNDIALHQMIFNCMAVTPWAQNRVRINGIVQHMTRTWPMDPPRQLSPTIAFENPKIPSSTFFLFLLSLFPDLHPRNFPSSSSKTPWPKISSYQPLLIFKKKKSVLYFPKTLSSFLCPIHADKFYTKAITQACIFKLKGECPYVQGLVFSNT